MNRANVHISSILDENGNGKTITVSQKGDSSQFFALNGENITLENLQFNVSDTIKEEYKNRSTANVITIAGNNVKLKNVKVVGTKRAGISIYKATGVQLENVNISGVQGGNAAIIVNGSQVSVKDIKTQGGAASTGIEVSYGSGVNIDEYQSSLNITGDIDIEAFFHIKAQYINKTEGNKTEITMDNAQLKNKVNLLEWTGYTVNKRPNIISDEATIEVGSKFNPSEYVNVEDDDGTDGLNIEIVEEVNTDVVGTYNVTCIATDKHGAKSTKIIKLNVIKREDGQVTVKPEISEDGTVQIPEDVLESENTTVEVLIPASGQESINIPTNVFDAIQGEDKNLILSVQDKDGKDVYTWIFNGRDINENIKQAINLVIEVSDKNDNGETTVKFAHQGSLPGNAKLKLNVEDKYNNGQKLRVTKSTVTKVTNDIRKVTDGYIEIDVEKNLGSYILKPVQDEDSTGPIVPPTQPPVTKPQLTDIKDHWANNEIQSFVDKGHIDGYPDNTFKPDQGMKRGEFVKLFNRVFNLTTTSGKTFADVPQGSWLEKEIDIAVTNGVAQGVGENKFDPERIITREEAAKMLANYMKISDNNHDKMQAFPDVDDVSIWAKNEVEIALEKGYLQGVLDGNTGIKTLSPSKQLTRAEAVTMLSRVK